MKKSQHRLLRRQIKKYLPEDVDASKLDSFLDAIDLAYKGFDEDLSQAEHTLEQSSQELFRVNGELRKNVAAKTAEAEVLSSRIESIVTSVNEILFQTDLFGNWTYLNSSWERITGYTTEESLGKNFLLNIHPDDREASAQYIYEVFQGTAENKRAYARYLTKNNKIRWAEAFVTLSLDNQGNAIGYSGTLNDVTDRHLAQQEITKLALVAKKTDNIVVVTDLEGKITWVNEAFTKLTGYQIEDVLQKKPGSFLQGPETDPATRAQMREAIAKRESFSGEVYNYAKNGLGYWLSISITPMADEDGEVVGFIAIELDVTAKKENEKKLNQARETLKFALEGNQYGMWDWDVPSNQISFSEVWKSMLGYKPSELKDEFSTWKKLIHPADSEKAFATLKAYVAGKSDDFQAEYRVKTKSHGYKWILSIGKAVSFKEGIPERIIGTHQDISNRKEAEKQLTQYAKDLEKTNSELDKFAYIVSHDLKAPLRAINNLSEWIEEDLDSLLEDENREQMALLRGRVKRMENLINGILQYSKAGRIKTDKKWIDVRAIVKDIIENQDFPEKTQIQLPEKFPQIYTEEIALQQVFSNLISNAIKYNDKDVPQINISFKELDNYYEFCVADNGLGIDKQFFDKVFVIFQTLESRDSRESTGVGLAIVQKIVEDHGGNIWVASKLGEGSQFYFSWPKS